MLRPPWCGETHLGGGASDFGLDRCCWRVLFLTGPTLCKKLSDRNAAILSSIAAIAKLRQITSVRSSMIIAYVIQGDQAETMAFCSN